MNENDVWVSVSNPSEIDRYKTAAKNTFKKDTSTVTTHSMLFSAKLMPCHTVEII